ncbi:MAG: hypothetical protein LBR30_00525 [Clostridioides sp.]|jgi:diaminopimelate epimerase|nr:hypothetical protein [Clostridioides sp.]
MSNLIDYYIYIPSGNDTAIVEGVDFSDEEKKIINDKIMQKHKNIEQVGFVNSNIKKSTDLNLGKQKEYVLKMAGGEFCANATRCASYYYLNGETGAINIEVSGLDYKIESGINDETLIFNKKNVWCKMKAENIFVDKLDEYVYLVKMNGITHIVVEAELTKKILESDDVIKTVAMDFIKKYEIDDDDAIGVMFLEEETKEKLEDNIKMKPVVWVKKIDTLFYETACASGTMSVGIVKSFQKNESVDLSIIQPSKKVLKVSTTFEDNNLKEVMIIGEVLTDGIKRHIEI